MAHVRFYGAGKETIQVVCFHRPTLGILGHVDIFILHHLCIQYREPAMEDYVEFEAVQTNLVEMAHMAASKKTKAKLKDE